MEPLNPNIMMAVRYAISIIAGFALGKGWISAASQGPIVDALVQTVGAVVAVVPPLWAAFKVNNKPTT